MHACLLVLALCALAHAAPEPSAPGNVYRVDFKRSRPAALAKRSTGADKAFNWRVAQSDLDRITRKSPRNQDRFSNYVKLHPAEAKSFKTRRDVTPAEPFDVATLRRKRSDAMLPTVQHLKKRQSATTQAVSLTVDSVYMLDNCYYGDVAFGTPAQTLTIDFDTGSADLWVPDQAAINSQQSGGSLSGTPGEDDLPPIGGDNSTGTAMPHTPFIESQSSTFQGSSTAFSITYGSGRAAGTLARDVVTVGSLSVPNQVFAVVDQTSATFSQVPFDGLMGLAFSTIAESGRPNFFENLVRAGNLASSVFSFRLGRSADSDLSSNSAEVQIPNMGTLLFGGVDSDDYTGSIVYEPVTTRGYWETSTGGLELNGNVIAGTANTLVAWDSGTSLAYFPEAVAAAVAQAVGAQQDSSLSTLSGGTLYVMPCSELRDLQLSISFGGQAFAWDADDLNGGTVDNRGRFCALNLIGSDTRDPVGNLLAIVGDAFMKGVYTVFDLGNSRVGMAVAAGDPAPGSSSSNTGGGNTPTNTSNDQSSGATAFSAPFALYALLTTALVFMTR